MRRAPYGRSNLEQLRVMCAGHPTGRTIRNNEEQQKVMCAGHPTERPIRSSWKQLRTIKKRLEALKNN